MPYKDPQVAQEYHARWRARNRGRYAVQDKIYKAARRANLRAAAYGAPGTITDADVVDVLKAGRCHYCGRSPGLLTLDHVEPLHDGGANVRSNIVAACNQCNPSKGRSSAPGRWSLWFDTCVDCGTADRPHMAGGRCRRCYQRHWRTGTASPQASVPVTRDASTADNRVRGEVGETAPRASARGQAEFFFWPRSESQRWNYT